jgi:hypothetical protein
MSVGIFNTAIGIKGLRVMNPAGFPDPVMVEVPEIFVDYRLSPFFQGKAYFDTVRLNLGTLTIVKRADGKLNLHEVKALQPGQAEQSAAKEKASGKAPDFYVGLLELKVGKVIYKDYTKGAPPQVKEFNVNIDEKFERVANPYAFAGLIVSRALMKTTVAQLTGFDVKGLQGEVLNALRDSSGALGDIVGGAISEEGKLIGETGKTVDKAATGLKKLLGN